MRVALMIEGQEDVTWEDWVALAETCERSGIEALFRSDHYVSVMGAGERGSLDAWGTINALAARTTTLRLGTMVSPASFRHPSVLAKLAPPPTTSRAAGSSSGSAPAGRRSSTRPTASRSCRCASGWTCSPSSSRSSTTATGAEGPFTFAGRALHADRPRGAAAPVQRPHPPLIMGGDAGPARRAPGRPLRRRVQHGHADARGGRRAPGERSSRRARRPGREPIPFSRHDHGADRRRRGRARAPRRGPRGVDRPAGRSGQAAASWIFGTVEQALERLRAYARGGCLARLPPAPGAPRPRAVELIGRELVPASAGRASDPCAASRRAARSPSPRPRRRP